MPLASAERGERWEGTCPLWTRGRGAKGGAVVCSPLPSGPKCSIKAAVVGGAGRACPRAASAVEVVHPCSHL